MSRCRKLFNGSVKVALGALAAAVLVVGVGCSDSDDDANLVLGAGKAWTDRFEYGIGESDGLIFYSDGYVDFIDDYTWGDMYGNSHYGTWCVWMEGYYEVIGGYIWIVDEDGDDYPPLTISGNSMKYERETIFKVTNNVHPINLKRQAESPNKGERKERLKGKLSALVTQE